MPKSFLQSAFWVGLKQSEGKQLEQISGAWWEKRHVPFVGKYWYGAHVAHDSVEELITQARVAGVVFLRVDAADAKTNELFVGAGLKGQKVREEQPATSLILDLTQTEEELLAGMKSKTRYNIKVAQKHGVVTEVVEGVLPEQVFEQAWGLLEQTAKRHGISNHPKSHYQAVNQSGEGVWVLSHKDDELLSAHYCIGHDGRLVYLYGASSTAHKEFMSPYATQWATIKWAKVKGFVEYDFWGIAPLKSGVNAGEKLSSANFVQKHRFSGVTRFKIGFGGKVVNYPPTTEFVLRPGKYKWYRLLKFVRKFV